MLGVSERLYEMISPLNRSIIGERYSLDGPMFICVTSVAHLRLGASALKFLAMMLGAVLPAWCLYER